MDMHIDYKWDQTSYLFWLSAECPQGYNDLQQPLPGDGSQG